MPRKALRCSVELDIHCVTCPGVYLPHRDDVYISISLFRQFRRTQLATPSFPLLFHEKFRFDKVYITAYQPQQVADCLQDEHIRVELIQLSDVRECGRLLASYECNARDFLYPFLEYTVTYGCADRQVLMNRTFEFPGIAPKLEFSTKTILTEVDRPGLNISADLDYVYNQSPRSSLRLSRSPRRGRSHSRHRSHSRGRCTSYHHRRPTLSSVSHYRSISPGLSHHLDDLSLSDSRRLALEDEDKPPFVVRKVSDRLIGRLPGTKHPRPHKLRCSKSRSPPRTRSMSRRKKKLKRPLRSPGGGYLDDDYNLIGRRYGYSHKVIREPATDYSSYSDDEYSDGGLSDLSDPGPRRRRSLTRSSSYRRHRSPSPVLGRRSLRDRFEDDLLADMIERKVDEAVKRNRSRERPIKLASKRSTSRSHDEDLARISDLERDLEIARHRSLVHLNDDEYWTEKAAQYKGKSHRQIFNNNLEKIYTNMYEKAKKFDDRVY